MRKLAVGGLALVFAGFGWMTTARAAGDRPGPSVTYAPSWEAAVEEAKLLNLPLVVHSHGFY